MKILIIYFSGVGNTKMVANKIHSLLKPDNDVKIYSIEKIDFDLDLSDYDAMIIGFPTIHSAPSKPILSFINKLPALNKPMSTFIFTTCGLYSTNSLRIFAKEIIKKNITPVFCRSYRCAATDGTLIAPYFKFMFTHDKKINFKLEKDTLIFLKKISDISNIDIPHIKWYSILNYPNKFIGQRYKFTIHLHKGKCIKCRKCIVNCPVKSITENNNVYPLIDKSLFINCYRCIHHCPQKALSLFKNKSPLKTLSNYEKGM